MKINKFVPLALCSTIATIPMFTSCSNNLVHIRWKLKNGAYAPKTRGLPYRVFDTIEELNNKYFDDVKDNPRILADDTMFSLFTFAENPSEGKAAWAPYEISYDLTKLSVEETKNDELYDVTISFSYKMKFIEIIQKTCLGEMNVEVENLKMAIEKSDIAIYGSYWCIMPLYTTYDTEEEITSFIDDKDWNIHYFIKEEVAFEEIDEYTFNSNYVKNASTQQLEEMSNLLNQIKFASYYLTEAGLRNP